MENKNLQVQSQNSNLQLTKQKNILSKYCINESEIKLVNAVFSNNVLNMNDLIDVVAKWKWMVGVVNNNQSEDDTAQELALLSTFIYNTYNSLKIDEINLAIQLSLSNKLDCDVNTYNSFSPLYVSRILNAYLEYKRKINSDITERKLIEDNKEMYNVEVTPK